MALIFQRMISPDPQFMMTKQLKEQPVAGYDWQLTIPFPEGKPVEDYFKGKNAN